MLRRRQYGQVCISAIPNVGHIVCAMLILPEDNCHWYWMSDHGRYVKRMLRASQGCPARSIGLPVTGWEPVIPLQQRVCGTPQILQWLVSNDLASEILLFPIVFGPNVFPEAPKVPFPFPDSLCLSESRKVAIVAT